MSVAVFPRQILVLPLMVTLGENTSTITVCVVLQLLFVKVPVTLYCVLCVGITVMVLPVELLLQEYVSAPITDITAGLPRQTTGLLLITLMLGNGKTETVILAASMHPAELVPTTLYCVVTVGFTEWKGKGPPGDHV